VAHSHVQSLPGMTDRTRLLSNANIRHVAASRGEASSAPERRDPEYRGDAAERFQPVDDTYASLTENMSIISGTPKTVLPKIRHVLESIRPGSIFFWDGDGSMTHEDTMRSLRLMGDEILPAVREMADELDLPGPFEVDPATNAPYVAMVPTRDGGAIPLADALAVEVPGD
jgi:hypothetical protein